MGIVALYPTLSLTDIIPVLMQEADGDSPKSIRLYAAWRDRSRLGHFCPTQEIRSCRSLTAEMDGMIDAKYLSEWLEVDRFL